MRGREGGLAHELRKIERVIADGVEDKILELVYDAQKIFSEGSHGHRATV